MILEACAGSFVAPILFYPLQRSLLPLSLFLRLLLLLLPLPLLMLELFPRSLCQCLFRFHQFSNPSLALVFLFFHGSYMLSLLYRPNETLKLPFLSFLLLLTLFDAI